MSSNIFYMSNYLLRVNLEEHVFHDEHGYGNNSTSTDENLFTLFWRSISRRTYLIVFSVLIILLMLATLIQSTMFISVCLRASVSLHNQMFNALTRATMYFFNTNSSGKTDFFCNFDIRF